MPKLPGDYELTLLDRGRDKPPRGDVTVRLTPREHKRLTWLLARLRCRGKARDAKAVRAGLVRILGCEVVELVEAQGHAGETLDVRLVLKVPKRPRPPGG